MWLAGYKELTTDLSIEYLRSQRLASNEDLGEVQTVDLKDFKGVDGVLRNLEINIVLPLENCQLASHFRLRSKRGVLLYGPPGAGKTTVCRALEQRLVLRSPSRKVARAKKCLLPRRSARGYHRAMLASPKTTAF